MEKQHRFWMWLAWHLPPILIYWCTIRAISHASTGKYAKQIVSDLSAIDTLQRWDWKIRREPIRTKEHMA